MLRAQDDDDGAGPVAPYWGMAESATHHLAELNIAHMNAPLDDPIMAGFVAELERINAVADSHPGFVWRLQSEAGDATAFRPFDDDMLVNLSLWETIDDLFAYTYASAHLEVFRRRPEWFGVPQGPHLVLWWVPVGQIPTIDEAAERLERLRRDGPTTQAFTFKRRFAAPEVSIGSESG